MKSFAYLILFVWVLSSLSDMHLVIPLSDLSDVTFPPLPIWPARFIMIYFLGAGLIKFGLSIYFLPRYIRKLRRGKSIKKAATDLASKVLDWI